MDIEDFKDTDLQKVLKIMKPRKSSGDDCIPPEFWRICLDSNILFQWLLKFCNLIWQNEQIPDEWRRAQVACLFKKGDPSCPDNYRPISLLQVGYNIFSALLLYRLQANNIEASI